VLDTTLHDFPRCGIPLFLTVNTDLRSEIWNQETLAIKKAAAELLTEGQSIRAAKDYITRSLDALELRLAVQAAAHKSADFAFAQILQSRCQIEPPIRD